MHWPRLLILCFSVALPLGASANNVSTVYGISSTLTWDDNYRLDDNDKIDDLSLGARVFGELQGGDETTKMRGGIGVGGAKHSASSVDNTENYELYTGINQDWERLDGSLDISYNYAPTTQTELLDTGDTRVDGTRKTLNIAPGISYQLDETNSVYSNFVYTDVRYDTVSLTNYTDNSVSLGWVHQLSETSNVSVNGSVSKYDPDDDSNTTITSVYLGYGFSSSEVTQYDFSLGVSQSDGPSGTSEKANGSFQMTHGIDERNTFSLMFSNGYVPSGDGKVRYEKLLNLAWNHALAERTEFTLSATGLSNGDRDYGELLVGGSHKLTRDLSLAANYRYRTQHGGSVDGNSNSVLLTLSYSPASESIY